MCVGSWAGVTYLRYTVLTSPTEEGTKCCPQLRSCFIGSCHVGVSTRFSRSISHAVYCLYTIFLSDQISCTCRSFVGIVYRMRSLAVSLSSEKKEPGNQFTTRVLYFFQGDSKVKPLLHWPPVTFISTSLRNCKKEGSLSTICSGSQSFPSASAWSQYSQ